MWQEIPAPVIAAVHGVALGGGFQIALGADIRIVAPDVKMSVLEVRWGLIPDMTGTQLLPKVVGLDVAKELTFTGRMIDGHEAVRLGVATRVSETPLVDALALAREIASKSPQAVRGAKALLNMAGDVSLADGFKAEERTIRSLIGTPEPGRGGEGLLREAGPGLRRLTGSHHRRPTLNSGEGGRTAGLSWKATAARASAVPPCCVTPNE